MRCAFLACAALLGIVILFQGMGRLPEGDYKANAQETQQPQPINPNTETKHDPATSKKAETSADDRSKEKEDHCKYGGPSWFAGFYCFFAHHEKFWIAFGTLVLAVATSVLGWATFFLWRATKNLVRGSEKTAEQQLRAYVHVETVGIPNIANAAEAPVAQVTIKNFGGTPARSVTNVAGFAIDRFPPPATLNFIIQDSEFTSPGRSRSDLAPGQPERSIETAPRTLSAGERAALNAGTLAIYVYGEIRYVTMGKNHWTRYRFLVGGPVGVRQDGSLVAWEDGNESS